MMFDLSPFGAITFFCENDLSVKLKAVHSERAMPANCLIAGSTRRGCAVVVRG